MFGKLCTVFVATAATSRLQLRVHHPLYIFSSYLRAAPYVRPPILCGVLFALFPIECVCVCVYETEKKNSDNISSCICLVVCPGEE